MAEMPVWRVIHAGMTTIGEVNRREVTLDQIMRANAVLDAQAAAEQAAMDESKRRH